jgi:hypothetical protein
MSGTKELLELEVLKQYKELLNKEKPKPKPWYDMQLTPGQLIRVYLLMLLAYPFLGPIYKMLLQKIL